MYIEEIKVLMVLKKFNENNFLYGKIYSEEIKELIR